MIKRKLIFIYIKFFVIRSLEILLLILCGFLYSYILSTFFPALKSYFFVFYLPAILYLLINLKIIVDKKSFAHTIEKHNDLKEYLISYYELTGNNEFKKAIEKRLVDIFHRVRIRIPFSRFILFGSFFSIAILEMFIIVFTLWYSGKESYVYFDRSRYTVFEGEGLEVLLRGKHLPDRLYIKGKKVMVKVPVRGHEVYVRTPKKSGLYLLTCRHCITSLVMVKPYPYVKVRGFVKENLSNKERKISSVDYVLKGSHIYLKLKSFNVDSCTVRGEDLRKTFKDTATVHFKVTGDIEIQAELFADGRKVDTTLYKIHVVVDAPPEVAILYPENTINPVLSDTERVIAYIRDDIGLSRGFAVLYGEGYKKLVFDKQYNGKGEDTISLSLVDPLGPLQNEVRLRIVGVDVGGKSGYAEIIYRKPTYSERLKEFMAIRDSIMGNGVDDENNFEEFDFKIKEMQRLNTVEREKLKKDLEKTLKETRRLEKSIENVKKIAENLKEITQDRELMKTLEEFNRTFLNLLDEKMQDLMRKLYRKNEVDSLNTEKLAKYVETIRKNRAEIIKELKKLKEFMKFLKDALDREEFVDRFRDILEKEKLLKEKTKYFEDIRGLANEQQRLEKSLDSISRISPEMWKEYNKELKDIKSGMKKVSEFLKKSQRVAAQKEEENLLKEMSSTFRKMHESLVRRQEERKRKSLLKIKELKNNLFFVNMVTSPYMDEKSRVLYRDGLSLTLSITDSLDALTYIRLFKSISLIRMAKEFVLSRPSLSYGLVNQAILDLLKKQNSIKTGGGQGTRDELEEMLKKLLSRQSSLTKEVSGILPMPLPIPKGAESILSRLGKMQQKLREMAEKLAKMGGKGEGKELKEAIKEMKKAEEELKRGSVDKSTVEHQRKALKHLLRAYRSIRKRELSRKRVSTPGKSFIPDKPSIPIELKIENLTNELAKKSIEAGFFGDPFVREYINKLKKGYETKKTESRIKN